MTWHFVIISITQHAANKVSSPQRHQFTSMYIIHVWTQQTASHKDFCTELYEYYTMTCLKKINNKWMKLRFYRWSWDVHTKYPRWKPLIPSWRSDIVRSLLQSWTWVDMKVRNYKRALENAFHSLHWAVSLHTAAECISVSYNEAAAEQAVLWSSKSERQARDSEHVPGLCCMLHHKGCTSPLSCFSLCNCRMSLRFWRTDAQTWSLPLTLRWVHTELCWNRAKVCILSGVCRNKKIQPVTWSKNTCCRLKWFILIFPTFSVLTRAVQCSVQYTSLLQIYISIKLLPLDGVLKG